MLDDKNTYQIINKDLTTSVQNKLNKCLKHLKTKNFLSNEQHNQLTCHNGVSPKMYFLPKIHKNDCPLRPIVSFVGSPLYKLSKFLAELLTYAFDKDEKYTKNSFEIVECLKTVTLPSNYIIVSLDAVSLFTNIPVDLTLDLIQKLWYKIEDYTSLDFSSFGELFNLCVKNSYFVFNKQYYKQIYGLGMGNCLSPVCADIVMSELQNHCLNQLSFRVPFFKRYVDDCVLAVPKNSVDELLTTFNSFHSKLQFTIEIETNNSLPFLDVILIRGNDGSIVTDWYQKPTFSERFLNFRSNHSMKQKLNIILNLKNRALTLSHPNFHSKNLEKIKSYLIKNNYPLSLIRKILYNNRPMTQQQHQQHNIKYYKIPYIKNLSEHLSRILGTETIKVAFKNDNTLKKIYTNTKDKTPDHSKSNVIYKIPCKNCNKCYIGQTRRYLETRLKEHKNNIKPSNLLRSNHDNETALVTHTRDGHSFAFDDVKIIGQQTNLKKRLLHEMISIKINDTINKRTDIDNLNQAYYNIIGKIKSKL